MDTLYKKYIDKYGNFSHILNNKYLNLNLCKELFRGCVFISKYI